MKRLAQLKIIISLLLLVCGLVATQASATPIVWIINNAQFDDGATLSGQFSVESTTGEMLGWDLTTTSGSSLDGFNYNSTASMFGTWFTPARFMVVSINVYRPFLVLTFTHPLQTAIAENPMLLDAEANYECLNCSPYRTIISGQASTVIPSQNSVPEPFSMFFLAGGLIFLGYLKKKISS